MLLYLIMLVYIYNIYKSTLSNMEKKKQKYR